MMPKCSSRNTTSLRLLIESRMPPVIKGVRSVSSVGSSPGRNSRRMKCWMTFVISCMMASGAPSIYRIENAPRDQGRSIRKLRRVLTRQEFAQNEMLDDFRDILHDGLGRLLHLSNRECPP